jgi:hypothetical protein
MVTKRTRTEGPAAYVFKVLDGEKIESLATDYSLPSLPTERLLPRLGADGAMPVSFPTTCTGLTLLFVEEATSRAYELGICLYPFDTVETYYRRLVSALGTQSFAAGTVIPSTCKLNGVWLWRDGEYFVDKKPENAIRSLWLSMQDTEHTNLPILTLTLLAKPGDNPAKAILSLTPKEHIAPNLTRIVVGMAVVAVDPAQPLAFTQLRGMADL